MKRNRQNILLNSPYIAWSVIFIIVPLIFVVYYAFTDQSGAFTFQNVKDFFTSGIYMPVFGRSVAYAFWATLICLIIGYPFAYCMTKINISAQRMCMLLIMLPMLMNLIVRTYSWRQILENNGIINKLLTSLGLGSVQFLGNAGIIIFGMVYNYLPFMILPIYSVMSKLDKSLLEAAEDLGSNSFSKFKRVIFPLSRPGVISGITMVFVPSVSTFYISQKLGGNKTMLIGDTIEYFFNLGPSYYNIASAISLVLMVMILICLFIMNRFSDDEDGGVLM